ncbi:uncharacterized protein LOC111254685 [Varroa destructor]|uniref:Uncharacterized protein n=2 Tax=Varroa TaxID=62624 RepID=A0A7M7KTL8_VARDE|nr:uncharacterized protein LOC111254685 [Varroa destructor]
MRTSTLSACCCLLLLGVTLVAEPASAQRQKVSGKKATTENPAYDDYEEYDQGGDAAADGANDKVAASAGPKSTSASPDKADSDDSAGAHGLLKHRLRLKNRPSPHPAVRPKPTLPSFIKHPANIEDLGHEKPHVQKPTEAPLPRPKATSAKPHRFSSTLRKKQTPAPAKDDADYEYDDEPAEKQAATSAGTKKPQRPRRL